MQGLELSWEEDPEFAVEVTVENDWDYQPKYYFQKKLETVPVEKSPRPQGMVGSRTGLPKQNVSVNRRNGVGSRT